MRELFLITFNAEHQLIVNLNKSLVDHWATVENIKLWHSILFKQKIHK